MCKLFFQRYHKFFQPGKLKNYGPAIARFLYDPQGAKKFKVTFSVLALLAVFFLQNSATVCSFFCFAPAQ